MRTDAILEQQLAMILAAMMPGNRRVLQVMLRTGLRVGDVLALPRDKIGRQFTVTEAKTGKRMKCGLPEAQQRRKPLGLSESELPEAAPNQASRVA